jgi:hypothetical protein
MPALLQSAAYTTGALLTVVAVLHLIPRLGPPGKVVSAWLCRAPGLDMLITLLTVAPLIVGPAVWGWPGLAGGIVGQFGALFGWEIAHELWHWNATKGPRIVKVHNRIVGPVRNILALVLTSAGVPVFWLIRVVEMTVYPGLVVLVNFPPIRDADYVNVSRHRVSKLVGHDRIWCLYCDWMTGVWSLGTEMLRNVESFWCPIRFHSELKCENCRKEFPDIDGGWSPWDAGAEEAGRTVERQYESPRPPSNAWFGHKVRLTVKGEPPENL